MMRCCLLVILLAVGVSSCASLGPPYPDFINLTDPSPYPFSSAVRSGPYLFLSGQIGTKTEDGKILANGGRVLNICARGKTVREAQTRAYAAVDRIKWPDGFCRRDIGWRAIEREK